MKNDVTVIYNDTCPICSREVDAYMRMTQRLGRNVSYAGLSACDLAQFGLSPEDAARRFHLLKNGTMYAGIPAFAQLWSEIPRLRWLAKLVSAPGLSWLAAKIYDHILAPLLFAMHRRRDRHAG